MIKKLSFVYSMFILISYCIILIASGCTIQLAPQDSSATKKSESQTYNFDFSKKKSKKDKQATTVQKEQATGVIEQKTNVIAGDIVWVCFSDCNTFRSQWGQAKIVTPASEATRGEYEVQWLWNTHATVTGGKKWTKDVILKWHRAKIDELKPGMVILCGSDCTSYPGVVKEVLTYKNAVIVENFWQPTEKTWTETWEGERLAAVKIIDEPVMKNPKAK